MKNYIKPIICAITITLLLASSAWAEQTFEQANQAYKESKFDNAISLYEKMLSTGHESSSIYYNLGNCFMKKGDIAQAILNYERAKQIIPRDPELKANLVIANSKIENNTLAPKMKLNFFNTSLFVNNFTSNELTATIFILYLCIISLLTLILHFPKQRRLMLSFVILIFIFFVLGNITLYAKITRKEAIIMNPKTPASFEPLENSTIFFELPLGLKVRLLESKDGWAKIQRSDEKAGWIPAKNIKTI